MPADINAYALGLELQLQADKAFQTLDKFKEQLAGVEKALVIAPTAFEIPGIERSSIAARGMGINIANVDVGIQKAISTVMQFHKTITMMNEGTGLLTKSTEEQIEKFKEMREELEPFIKELKKVDLEKTFGPDKTKMIEGMLKTWDGMDKALKIATKEAEEHTVAFKSLVGVLGMAGESGAIAGKAITDLALGVSKATAIIALLTKGFSDLINMQEAYAPITMRAIGSQRELIEATNDLRVSLGATTEEATATFRSLAAAGFRSGEAVGEMAKVNYMFSQATGISAKEAAKFQRAVFTTGRDAEVTTRMVSEMSAVIRNSGMSAEEASQMIGNLTEAMRPLRFLYGEEQALAGTQAIAKFAGAIRAAGGDANAFQRDMLAMAKSPQQMITSFGMMGVKGKRSLENLPGFFEAAGNKLAKMQAKADSAGQALVSENWAKASGLSLETADAMVQLWNAADHNVAKFNELANAQTSAADVEDDFNSTLQSLTRSLKQVVQPLMALGSVILDTIVPALTVVLQPLILIGKAIAGIVNFFGKIPVLGTLFKAALGAGLIAMLITVLGKWKSFHDWIAKTVNLVKKGTRDFRDFFKAIHTGMLPETTAKKLEGLDRGFKSVKDRLTTATKNFKDFNLNSLKSVGGIKAGIASVGASIGGFIRGLKGAAGAAVEAAPSLAGTAASFFGVGEGALSAAFGIAKAHPVLAAIVGVIVGALVIVPKLFEMFDKGSATMRTFGAILMVLSAPLIAVFVTLRALWAIIKGIWEAISEALTEAFKPLLDVLEELGIGGKKGVGIMETLGKVMNWLTGVVKIVFKALSPLIWVIKLLGIVIKGLAWVIKAIFHPIDAMKEAWQGVTNFFKSAWEKTTGAIKSIWNATVNAIRDPVGTLKSAWKKASEWIRDTWKSAVDKMKSWWHEFTSLFEKTEKKANNATNAVQHHMGLRMQKAAEHLKAMSAHRAVTNFGAALKTITKPEVSRAVDKAYAKADAISQPIIKNNIGKIAQPADPSSARLLLALHAIYEVIAKTSRKDGDQSLENIEALIKQYFPQFAEKKDRGGLGHTAANSWMG